MEPEHQNRKDFSNYNKPITVEEFERYLKDLNTADLNQAKFLNSFTPSKYYVISKEIIDRLVGLTGMSKQYFEQKLIQATNYNYTTVIWVEDGEWKQVNIVNRYNILHVMKQKFGLDPA